MQRLQEFKGSSSSCLSNDVLYEEYSKGYCAHAYTAKQLARRILPELRDNRSVPTKFIVSIVNAKQIYIRQLGSRHFHLVKTEVLRLISTNILQEMASKEGYAFLSCEIGHYVHVLYFFCRQNARISCQGCYIHIP